MIQDPRAKNEIPEASSISEYFLAYAAAIKEAAAKVSPKELEKAFNLLNKAAQSDVKVYVAGNGGSASISDHLCCDFLKGTYFPGKNTLHVHSLVGSVGLFTALANDYGYEKSISHQVEILGKPGDLIILISSSGNSPNIVKAAEAARARQMNVIGMTGFTGGELSRLSHASLHVPINNYGMAEDLHQMLMHTFTQYLINLRVKEGAK